MKAGSMEESEESSTPKLSLLSTSSMWEWELPEAQGSRTPPIVAPLSIPFKWEEAPGKPKPRDIASGLSASRSLHLPPRLLLHEHGSPSFVEAGTKLFAVSSLRSRSYSSRADLVSHSHQRPKFDSPTSILNSPPSSTSSRGSSTDIGSVLTDGDEVARLHKLVSASYDNKQSLHCGSTHKMRRLLDYWTPSLRWPKLKEESAPPPFSDDHHESHCGAQSQAMPSTLSCIAPRKKWVLRKMKRSSQAFGTILKRMRSRISGEEGR